MTRVSFNPPFPQSTVNTMQTSILIEQTFMGCSLCASNCIVCLIYIT